MPSPVKSKPVIREREKTTKDSSRRSRLEARNENEGSSHEIVKLERGRLDFYPPQNNITRTSPPHKIRETNFSPFSSPFASSTRGGRAKRFSAVSEKDHEAARRAVWEVTSKKGRHTDPPLHARKMVRHNHYCFLSSRRRNKD